MLLQTFEQFNIQKRSDSVEVVALTQYRNFLFLQSRVSQADISRRFMFIIGLICVMRSLNKFLNDSRCFGVIKVTALCM